MCVPVWRECENCGLHADANGSCRRARFAVIHGQHTVLVPQGTARQIRTYLLDDMEVHQLGENVRAPTTTSMPDGVVTSSHFPPYILSQCPLQYKERIWIHLFLFHLQHILRKETKKAIMKFQNHHRKFFHHQHSSSKNGRSLSSSSSTSTTLIGFFLYLVLSQRHTIAILCILAVSVTILFHVDWITSSSSTNNASSSLAAEDLLHLQQARIAAVSAAAAAEATTTTNNKNIRQQTQQILKSSSQHQQDQQGQLAPAGSSQLDLSKLPSCSALRLSLDDDDATLQRQFKLDRPTIFTDWGRDNNSMNEHDRGGSGAGGSPIKGTWDFNNFQQTYGKYYNYVKGVDVQPLLSLSSKQENGQQVQQQRCITTTKTLMDSMNNSHGIDLLFFTNNIENPQFLTALKQDYMIPSIIQNITKFQTGFDVFSAMSYKSSHPFHKHDVAWLGQVTGSRLWFLLPPTIPRSQIGTKINACEYIHDITKLPLHTTKLVQACVQHAGDVMYLPAEWWHATCSLETWSVGIGGQGGTPKKFQQDFNIPTDLLAYYGRNAAKVDDEGEEDEVEDEMEKINECLAIAATIQRQKKQSIKKT